MLPVMKNYPLSLFTNTKHRVHFVASTKPLFLSGIIGIKKGGRREAFLIIFYKQMRHAQRNITLLLDNASSHNAETIQNFSNIYVHFLPPNTTSCLQPIDQGIGYSLKVNFPYTFNL